MFKYLLLFGILLSTVVPVAAQDTCGTLSPRLQAGETARVTPGTPNNMRDQPTTNGTRIGQIPGEAEFTVISGPVCADGYTWWEVDFEGLRGFTVESIGETYVLEPVITPTSDVSPTPTVEPTATPTPTATPLPTTRQTANHVLWSLDGSVLAVTSDEGVWLYDGADFDARPRLIAPRGWQPLNYADNGVPLDLTFTDPRVALSHDGTRLATAVCLSGALAFACDTGSIDIWDTSTDERLRRYAGNAAEISGLSFTADRTVLAFGSSDQLIRLWNTRTNAVIQVLETNGEVKRVQIAPDRSRLGASMEYAFEPGLAVFFTANDADPLGVQTGGPSLANRSAVFSPDVSWVAFNRLEPGEDQYTESIRVVNMTPDFDSLTELDIYTIVSQPDKQVTIPDVTAEAGETTSSAFSFTRDSRRLAVGYIGGEMRLWDLENDSELLFVDDVFDATVFSIAYHPDGDIFAAISNDQVFIFDAASGEVIAAL